MSLVRKWFLGGSAMVFGTVCVGGITRLTESGLSITEWNLIDGMIWPNDEKWTSEFQKYKNSNEFKLYNQNMELNDFKRIYYWEWLHRNMGRATGAYFLLPTLLFTWKRKFTRGALKAAWFCSGLVGFQGFLGWFMVKQGVDKGKVSQYKLCAHLGTAYVLYLTALSNGLQSCSKLKLSGGHATAGLAFLTCLSGALVAGLDAGLIYGEWPLMGSGFVPSFKEMFPDHRILNLFENQTTVQFQHRTLAYLTLIAIMRLTWKSRNTKVFKDALMLQGAALAQASLGISTLIYMVPVPLAALHQAGSLTLMSFALNLCRKIK